MPTSATSTSRRSSSERQKCRRCKRVRCLHACDKVEDCFAEGLCKRCSATAGEPQHRLIVFELEGLPAQQRFDLIGVC